MPRYVDYYRILQVHYLAEQEVIESAYKRLAKKYHPDVNKNKNAAEMMQKLNQAYGELGDPVKRSKYNLQWQDKYNKPESDYEHERSHERNEKSLLAAKSVLDEYFRNIMNNRFDFSYELISSFDKRNITRDDFINWQHAVSTVFQLTGYKCGVLGITKNKRLNGCMFRDAAEFIVNVVEYNTIMDMTEKDVFTKMTVMEDGKWRVFIGYEELQPIISKFTALTGLLAAKSVIRELVETHSRSDSMTGLLNQRGIIERVKNEIHRYERYGNSFSLIMLDIDIVKMIHMNLSQDVKEHAVKFVAEILLNNIRKLDIAGRWGEKTFLILLPETGLTSAIKATQKIYGILETKRLTYSGRNYKISAKFGTAEYKTSLEETLERIRNQIVLQ